MILEILKYPNPLLKKKSAPVSHIDPEIQELIDNMLETMYAAPGVGLAAPQVGVLKRVLVVDIGRLEGEVRRPDPKAIVNPAIVSREGKILWEEGCLSCPTLVLPVERSQKVVVKGQDRDGKEVSWTGEDLLAVAFQHEIDHMDGVLLVDRLSRLKRDLYVKKLERDKRAPAGKGASTAYIG